MVRMEVFLVEEPVMAPEQHPGRVRPTQGPATMPAGRPVSSLSKTAPRNRLLGASEVQPRRQGL
jgi:hypothetical protein